MSPIKSGRRSDSIEIAPLGDSAFIVRVSEGFTAAPAKTLGEVLEAMHRIEQAHIPGVIECAPAYNTVAVFFNPVEAKTDQLPEEIRAALRRSLRRSERTSPRSIEIPVCFDPEFAPDLAHVAANAHLPANEVVDLYCGAEYRVACIGFTPGFPFLTGLPKTLATPRRAVPRKEIPAGSVAIGGEQTGIYPIRSPGGWNVIGRTSLRLFDPEKTPPAVLQAGDQVRFRAITREDFERSTS
jgi:inhibitor of KinA